MGKLSEVEVNKRREIWASQHGIDPGAKLLESVSEENIESFDVSSVSTWEQSTRPMFPNMLEQVMANYKNYEARGLAGGTSRFIL